MMKKYPATLLMILMLSRISVVSEPVSGVVFGVSETEIEILVSTGKPPSEGMPVEVFSEDGASVGTWSVTRTDFNIIYARPVNVSCTPQLGQTACIGESKPKPAVTPEAIPAKKTTHEAVTPVVSQPQQKAPAETTEALSSADQGLMDDLASGAAVRIRTAAKYLYRGRYESPVVMDRAAEVLLEKYNEACRDAMHVDSMAWICKALWVSGEEKYLPSLRTVESQATSPKLRKYAFKYRASLKQKNQQ